MFSKIIRALTIASLAVLLVTLLVFCADCGSSKSTAYDPVKGDCKAHSITRGDFTQGELVTAQDANNWCKEHYQDSTRFAREIYYPYGDTTYTWVDSSYIDYITCCQEYR